MVVEIECAIVWHIIAPDLWGSNGVRVRGSELIQRLLHVSHRYHNTMHMSVTPQATPTSSTHLQ